MHVLGRPCICTASMTYAIRKHGTEIRTQLKSAVALLSLLTRTNQHFTAVVCTVCDYSRTQTEFNVWDELAITSLLLT